MADPYIGEIRIFGFDYAPIGWVFCDGQLLPVAQYQALFAVMGNTFGGDGQNTVGVPNLKGQSVMSFGNGTGLTPRNYASKGGVETITLSTSQIPSHRHTVSAVTLNGTTTDPQNNFTGIHNEPQRGQIYKNNPTLLDAQFSSQAVGLAGGSTGHENRQPFLPLNFCLATEGIFPVRP